MKKIAKVSIGLSLMLTIILSGVTPAFAAYCVDMGSNIYINDSYNAPAPAFTPTTTYGDTADFAVSDYESFVRTVEQQFVQRNTSFTMRFDATYADADTAVKNLFEDVFTYDDPTTTSDLDYLHYNMESWGTSGRYYETTTGDYAIVKFQQSYLTTTSQEDTVNTKVATILQQLNVQSGTSYEKIKAVHDYILKNVTYDDALVKHSAYDAVATGETVCQGYALLTYKLLMELQVPVRIIVGTPNYSQDGHAWNIVNIGQYWYNYDATWDDQGSSAASTTKYFLKNNAGFTDHIRRTDYKTPEFNVAYPMSPLDYNPMLIVQSVRFAQAAGSRAVGSSFTLQAAVLPTTASNKTLTWHSSDLSVAVVNSAGTVTVVGTGTAEITAVANDGGGGSATYTLTAVAADLPDSWAKAPVEALNARGVVPAALMSGYRTEMTRAEFTALIVGVYEYAKGAYTLKNTAPFNDISTSAYSTQIAKGYELGLVGGSGAGAFTPEGTLTREQCAKIISTTVSTVTGAAIAPKVTLTYTDASKIDSWALLYVRDASEKELMTGSGTSFEPLGVLTREQAMVIAERMIEKFKW